MRSFLVLIMLLAGCAQAQSQEHALPGFSTNTALRSIAVDRRLETAEGDRTLTFGVSGMLRHSDMVMFDRETETLWQQFTGEALVGDLLGSTLTILPAQIVSFAHAREAAPSPSVLSRETGQDRDYGRNPYAGYDDVDKRPFLFDGPDNGRVAPMMRVIAVTAGSESRAYPADLTLDRGVVTDELGSQPLVFFHTSGTATALSDAEIASARDVGATGVFDPRVQINDVSQALTFERSGERFVDAETNSS